MIGMMGEENVTGKAEDLVFRPGTIDDSYTVFKVFEASLADLLRRQGSTSAASIEDPDKLARMWAERRGLYNHLAETAENFWLAERGGQVVGFSRSVLRDGMRELTEMFVLPDRQSAGVGRELLSRSFPDSGGLRKVIIASPDVRAQALYLKAGLQMRFSIYYFWREPESPTLDTDLRIDPVLNPEEVLELIGDIDGQVLGHRRDVDHQWLLSERQGYLYWRDSRPVGYGYIAKRSGPFALLEAGDFPAVLAHAERVSAESGFDHFGLEVPMVNHIAVKYLLSRGFRLEPFVAQLLSDEPFGQFENYLITAPPFIL
jgi:ribosomal protein S18 acetylase RimI-like enzyme